MKKILSLMLVMMMAVLALAGCGKSASDGPDVSSLKTIGDIMELDSEDSQYAVYEDVVVYAFKFGDTYYRAKAAITPEDSSAYFNIDYSDADYEEQQDAILSPLKIDEMENLSDQILPQEQLDALVGKTGQELQDEGWTFNGHNLDTMEFWMDHGPFLYSVVFDGTVPEADYESFVDEEGTKDMKVKSVHLDILGNATEIEE